MNLLFTCSANQWRSLTAEKLYSNCDGISVRSAGTNAHARGKVSAKDIGWADLVIVMEQKHKKRLRERFPNELHQAELHVLEIPDDFQFMDPELIKELRFSVNAILAL